jgi:hypothetical protein
MAISLGVRRLMVYGDSDLVVNQVMKEWDVRNPAMTGYCNAVRKLEKKFEGLELHHVPREKNQAADELAIIGSTRKPVPSDVFLEHLYSPSVQEDPFTSHSLESLAANKFSPKYEILSSDEQSSHSGAQQRTRFRLS